MAAVLIGKLIIAITLCFQAYVLLTDSAVISAFSKETVGMLTTCNCIPPNIGDLIKQYLRFVVIGLLFSSGLMVIFKTCIFKILVLLGLILTFIVENHGLRAIPKIGNSEIWQQVAIIGSIIYIMGA
jgi:hypothetical protein